jgi:predicted component of type VI protein secretion system
MGLLNKFRKEGQKKTPEDEVVNNLISLLNTKQQYGAWHRGLGLNAYSNFNSYAGAVNKIIEDIEYNIKHFEKRVQLIDIKLVDSSTPLYIKFQIQCKILGKFHAFYIGFTNYAEPISVKEDDDE